MCADSSPSFASPTVTVLGYFLVMYYNTSSLSLSKDSMLDAEVK